MKTLYYNGLIDTITLGFKEALVEENGKIVFIGDYIEAKKLVDNHSQIVDLEGKYLTAGFNDSHMHLLGYGYALMQMDLSQYTCSLNELLDYIKKYVDEGNFSGFARGRGWNQDYFSDEKRFVTKQDLDNISKEIPICITRACGHICVVNTKALEVAGVDVYTKQVEGGSFDYSLGIFKEKAMDLIYRAIPKPTLEDLKEMIKIACESLNNYGITSVQSDDFTVFDIDYQDVINAYQSLELEGELNIRVYEQSQLKNIDILRNYTNKGYKTGVGSDYFKLGPLKLLGDGSLGARTAFLNEVYYDDNNTCGIAIYTEDELYQMMHHAHINDMQIAIHGIGDAMIDRILNVYERILEENPKEDHRHGVIHCQIMNHNQVERFKDLNLIAYVQSIFLDYDILMVENRVGKDRASTSYIFKTLNDRLLNVSNGSDAPVEKPDVFKGIQCLTTRKTIQGDGPYLMEEAYDMKDALASFTIKGAYASFEEDKKGSLEIGKYADFVILNQNPYEVKEEEIHQIEVYKTIVNGKCVYQS